MKWREYTPSHLATGVISRILEDAKASLNFLNMSWPCFAEKWALHLYEMTI